MKIIDYIGGGVSHGLKLSLTGCREVIRTCIEKHIIAYYSTSSMDPVVLVHYRLS